VIRARPTVLFDFDGVLIRGDSFSSFVKKRLGSSAARFALAVPMMAFLLMKPTRRFAARHCVRVALLGLDTKTYENAIDAFAEQLHARDGHVIAQGVTRVRQHMAAGDRVIVVTGCERGLARRLLDRMNLREVELVASRLGDARFGLHPEMHNYGAEKVRQLEAIGVVPRWQRAYSDSIADVPMLVQADEPVLVNASDDLRARVTRALGRDVANETWV
jgi:phosphatidylglycerophosphatase C